MALKKYEVTYKAGGYQFKDNWEAEDENEARKVAKDFYRQELDDFQGIIKVEEI